MDNRVEITFFHNGECPDIGRYRAGQTLAVPLDVAERLVRRKEAEKLTTPSAPKAAKKQEAKDNG